MERMSEEDMKKTVMGLATGDIFAGCMVHDPDLLSMVFMPIALGALTDIDLSDVGDIIADMKDAGPRAINGYPMFAQCRLVQKDDWDVIIERVAKTRAALEAAAGGG